MSRLPVMFIGHGSPMYALDPNRYTQSWADSIINLPKPVAILMISAHWYTRGTRLGAMPTPQTIHDFRGFPDELYAVKYPAPGSPKLAKQIFDLLHPTHPTVTLEESEWGLDHGAWSILKYMYPLADIPVVQMSIDASLGHSQHVAIGQTLRPLRDQGILIISSGNIVHNLGQVVQGQDVPPATWASTFETFFKEHVASGDFSPLINWQDTQFAQLAIPTPDHYLPALYTFGLKHPEEQIQILTEGIEMSTISMLSFAFA